MTKKGSLLIRGGKVIDPASSFVGERDILVRGNSFVDVAAGER
jgi:hypothetical protein